MYSCLVCGFRAVSHGAVACAEPEGSSPAVPTADDGATAPHAGAAHPPVPEPGADAGHSFQVEQYDEDPPRGRRPRRRERRGPPS